MSVLLQSAWDLLMDKKIEAKVGAVYWNMEVYKGGDRLKSLQQTCDL